MDVSQSILRRTCDKTAGIKSRLSKIKIFPIPPFVFKAFRTPENPIEDIPLEEHIEPTLAVALKDYQKEGVCYGIAKSGRVLIGDDMGLGKTHQGIALAHYYKNDWPLLIATSASMRKTWMLKLQELLPGIDPVNIFCVKNRSQEVNNSARIVVTSYPLMSRFADALLTHNFRTIILDESHNVKNYNTKKTRATQTLCEGARRVILLSGTAALSRPKELYTQLALIDPNFATFKDFSERYCAAYKMEYGWECNGESYLEELRLLLNKRFMIRHTKAAYMEGLTNKLRERIFIDIDLPREERMELDLHARLYCHMNGILREDEIFFAYYAGTAAAKVNAVRAYLAHFIPNTTDKCIIFAYHIVMMDGIEEELDDLNVEHVRIDGSKDEDDREAFIHRFQTDDDCRVAIMSLISCSTGLNLTAAKQVIFAELTYTPGVRVLCGLHLFLNLFFSLSSFR